MRNLTIKRQKSFVACLGKMKVYIEDAAVNDLVIHGLPCRKLGTLKNGEEKTFEIGESAARIFVIADKVSKEYCNEFYDIPEGSEDIYLTGKNHFNPGTGNGFRFDGNNCEGVIENRKKGARKGWIVLACAIVIGFIVGIMTSSSVRSLFNKPDDKVFSKDGMRITLTEEFQEVSMDGFVACYGTDKISLLITNSGFDIFGELGQLTAEEYGEMVVEINGIEGEVLEKKDGLVFYEYDYTNTNNNTEYHYYSYVYKGADAFWLFQFAVASDNAAKYESDIENWAASVRFE